MAAGPHVLAGYWQEENKMGVELRKMTQNDIFFVVEQRMDLLRQISGERMTEEFQEETVH